MKFRDLMNQTFVEVKQVGKDEIYFIKANGDGYKLYHAQDCCEDVYIESVVGSLKDLENTPILMAEEATQKMKNVESGTWTFYKLATIKGYVDIRWNGQSNGWYSESVDICKIANR